MAAAPTPQDKNQQVADLKAQIMQGGSGAGTTSFLGMPSGAADYNKVIGADVAAQQSWKQGRPAAAYANGAEMMPVFQSWNPQDISALQNRLVKSGLLSNTDFRAGVWDDKSQKAFGDVLGTANAMGSPWQDALTSYETGRPMQWDSKTGTYVQGTAGTARTKAPVITRFTSPDDLATTANEVATQKLGRTFTHDELTRFVAAYHGTESAESAGQGAASGITGGGFTAGPAPKTAATTFAEQADPTAFAGEKFLDMANHINTLIKGPQVATTKPMSV